MNVIDLDWLSETARDRERQRVPAPMQEWIETLIGGTATLAGLIQFHGNADIAANIDNYTRVRGRRLTGRSTAKTSSPRVQAREESRRNEHRSPIEYPDTVASVGSVVQPLMMRGA